MQALSVQIGQLNENLTSQISDLAIAVAKGFENTATKSDLNELGQSVNKINLRLEIVETKLDKALYKEITNHETRIRRLEEKTGIIT